MILLAAAPGERLQDAWKNLGGVHPLYLASQSHDFVTRVPQVRRAMGWERSHCERPPPRDYRRRAMGKEMSDGEGGRRRGGGGEGRSQEHGLSSRCPSMSMRMLLAVLCPTPPFLEQEAAFCTTSIMVQSAIAAIHCNSHDHDDICSSPQG